MKKTSFQTDGTFNEMSSIYTKSPCHLHRTSSTVFLLHRHDKACLPNADARTLMVRSESSRGLYSNDIDTFM